LKVVTYQDDFASKWDDFVRTSKNGTFLHERGYMDYHRDRFPDRSFIVTDDAGGSLALFPATSRGRVLSSHAGLTYGGFITTDRMTTPVMLDCFAAVCDVARAAGFDAIAYKTVPFIYHRLPAEEDRYALFRLGAQLHRRDVLSVIERGNRAPVQERRRRGVRRAANAGVVVEEMTDFAPFWAVLEATLGERHGTKPAHTLAEMNLLASRFPGNVRLHVARLDAEVQAGIVMYVSPQVAHAQYIAATPAGRASGALDLLIEHLVTTVYHDTHWFDFGISNEDDGRLLNIGLVEQKEGFGARALVHDHYTLSLAPAL
jgi:hypothetical protein